MQSGNIIHNKIVYKKYLALSMLFLVFFLSHVLIVSSALAKMSKCGPGNCRNLCLEYETENIKVGESQGYYISGGTGPFKITPVQNMGLVRVDWISPRSFRITGVQTTDRFGVGPVQFYVWEDVGYKCATGNAFLYIHVSPVVQPPGDKPHPPKPDPQTVCNISGVWRHGTTETWTFTPLGNNRYSAQEQGFGNASGTAVVTGNRVRIDYVTRDGRIRGYYDVGLSADCNLAEGRWSDSQPAGGPAKMVRVSSGITPPGGGTVLHGDVVLTDEFKGAVLDTSKWEVRAATGKGTGFGYGQGQNVSVSGDTLTLRQNATDNGGAVVTKPIAPVFGKILKITKQTFVHYTNNNYTGATAILGEDTSKDLLALVGYYNYGDVNAFGPGFVRSMARLTPIWDTWFNEVITYDPASGNITLSINGGAPATYAGRPTSTPFRVGLHSYGWFTGHYQTINNIRIEWVDTQPGITPPPPLTDIKPRFDINGLWQCQPDIIQNCYTVFYQEGNEIKALNTYYYEGRKIVWFGAGTIQDHNVNFSFHHTSNTAPSGWQDGTMDLTVSQDNNLLSGTYKTLGSQSVPIQFKRVQ